MFSDTFFCVVIGHSMHHVERAVASLRVCLVKIVRLVILCMITICSILSLMSLALAALFRNFYLA